MEKVKNPFEFEAANNLPDEEIIDFYIDDYNYSRFINTTRNIFIQGARGTGKTMSLLYNSFKIQNLKAKIEKREVSYDKIGIYIPCNTPLFHKGEHLLLKDEFKASLLTEHYLVLTIVNSICTALLSSEKLKVIDDQVNSNLKSEINYLLDIELPQGTSFLKSMALYSDKSLNETQDFVNGQIEDELYKIVFNFSSLVKPFLNCLREIPELTNSHFLFLIDDAHDLNIYQKKTINSWIAYRDHSQFSFKVATAETNPLFITNSGGVILEGHDFISVDMLKPYQNKDSEFGKMAKKIIFKRLEKLGVFDDKLEINDAIKFFFPKSPTFEKDLKNAREIARKEAEQKFDGGVGSQVSDYVAKYTRAIYFRKRSARANLPPYSGFDTIVDVSTGVIRNLLDPCYWMFDAEISKLDRRGVVKQIPHGTQKKVLESRSNKLWERAKNLDKSDVNCSQDRAKMIGNLFENLMRFFSDRLKEEISEPRAVTFVISEQKDEELRQLLPLIEIAIKAQLLYTRVAKHKNSGKNVTVYVPNRILLISKGLDPHGQYASVYIKSRDLLNAAKEDKKIPLVINRSEADPDNQLDIFNG